MVAAVPIAVKSSPLMLYLVYNIDTDLCTHGTRQLVQIDFGTNISICVFPLHICI